MKKIIKFWPGILLGLVSAGLVSVFAQQGTGVQGGTFPASKITGTVTAAHGGTGLTTATDDNVMVGNGTAWQSKALTSCSAASSAVTYNTSTNAWGCNTIASGGFTESTFSGTSAGCTTTPAITGDYAVSGNVVIISFDTVSCTSNATTFSAAAGTLPVAIRPTQSVIVWLFALNNGAATIMCADIQTNGSINFGVGITCSTAGWTAALAKGPLRSAGTYMLNN